MSLTLMVLLCGCESRPVAEPPELSVELEEVSDFHLMLTYQSSRPLESLQFYEAGGFFRERRWEVLTPGYAFTRDLGAQLVRLEDGADAQFTLDVKIHLQPDSHPRRYDHAIRFTNGLVAVYSGYLNVMGMAADTPAYIVLGDAVWMEDRGIRYLFDAALPEWMTYSTQQHLPAILEVYRERLGLELGVPVQLMMSFHPDSEVTELTGAALPGQIHIGVHGTEWEEDSPWAERRLHRLLAHEAAHLWNAGLVRFVEGTPPSLYEGGAEALGIRTLFALGLVDAATLSATADAAAEHCAAGTERRDYVCGHAVANLVEQRSLASDGSDLFTLWGRLLRHAQAGSGRYDEDAWEAVLAAAGIALSSCRGDTSAHPVAGMEC